MTKQDDLKQQIELICIERGLEPDEVITAINNGIASAYRKEFGDKEAAYEAVYNIDRDQYAIFQVTMVVDEVGFPGREMTIVDARLFDPNAQVGDAIRKEISIENEVSFGRIASQIARQVLAQSIKNSRHSKILQKFKDQIGEVVNVEIDFYKRGGYQVKLGQTTGYMGREHLLPNDKFKAGQIIKALIVEITEDERGNSRVTLSRTHPDFVRSIITREIPEVASGAVKIVKIVREPGARTKLLVSASDEDQMIDPVGAILGRKNVRITNVMREITSTMQEKVDVIEHRPDEFEEMVMDALEPAEIDRLEFDEAEHTINVFCYPEEASLAVGRRGTNVRLASQLVDWDINIETIEEQQPEINFE